MRMLEQQADAKPELVTTTVKDYDLAETGKAMRSLFVVSYSSPLDVYTSRAREVYTCRVQS